MKQLLDNYEQFVINIDEMSFLTIKSNQVRLNMQAIQDFKCLHGSPLTKQIVESIISSVPNLQRFSKIRKVEEVRETIDSYTSKLNDYIRRGIFDFEVGPKINCSYCKTKVDKKERF